MHKEKMSHREILEALTGLLLAMFVAMLSSTIVSNALPTIVEDLKGSQTGYTWVVVATLLAMTATTPIWGKLSDLYSKKLLVQIALVVFVAGSTCAGLAQNMEQLIGARVIQGLGIGGLTALVQVVIAAMVSPRERGRYSGYIGAVFASATIIGPLIGGAIVDSPLGWRWCFFMGAPIAVLAFFVLQFKLHLPPVTATTKLSNVDWLGATLLTGGIATLLAWVSLGGSQYPWASGKSIAIISLAVLLLCSSLIVEHHKGKDAIIPLFLFKDRTTALATVSSLLVGVALFASTVYLSQYFQLARGMTPTHAGLMSIPNVLGLMISTTISGRLITKTGYWKKWLVGGMVVMTISLLLLGTIDEHTSLYVVGLYQVIMGLGLGCVMQNLVLAVQNNSSPENLGASSSLVAFFRSMGGSLGVAAMGAVLSSHVAGKLAAGMEAAGMAPPAGSSMGDFATMPEPLHSIYQHAFGTGVAEVFLIAVPFAVLSLLLVLFIEEVPLKGDNIKLVEKTETVEGIPATS